jgi:zinc protease
MADLERMKVEELRHWYESWYAPNNATLVVVGDVTPTKSKPWPRNTSAPSPSAPCPRQAAAGAGRARRAQADPACADPTAEPDLRLQRAGLATAKDPRTVNALRLISALLDGGYSARMPARLERGQELVAGASSSYNAFTRGDSLFLISATPNVQKKKTLAEVEKGVWQLLDELKTTPPTAEELERVRAQVIAGLVYDRDSISSQATTIGQLETVGLSWKLIDSELDDLKRDPARHPERRPHLFHPRTPERCPCTARGVRS